MTGELYEKNRYFHEDIRDICKVNFIPWEQLAESSILITGSTGLIGSMLVGTLVYLNKIKHINSSIFCLVRNEKRAKEKLRSMSIDIEDICFLEGCVEHLPQINDPIDFIIHGASRTSSREFITNPVEVIETSVIGTKNLLNFAKEKGVKRLLYMSSMEVYGYPQQGCRVTEKHAGALSPLEIRNSYPISKQMCEVLCCAFCSEYNVPTSIIRLTQTFGPGVHICDKRIFAYFARCVKNREDIILRTMGDTKRSYLYIADAVTAIFTVLFKGADGQAYNAANERTFCSIYEMAELVAADNDIQLKIELDNNVNRGYANTLYMDLDTTLLQSIGWKMIGEGYSLREMYRRMIADIE